MDLMGRLLAQCRRPTGRFGRFIAWGMNFSHSRLADWGLGHISIGRGFTILDIGCGGGGTVRKLAGIAPEGKVYGIDYSEESVRISRKTNRMLIEKGRVSIERGSVSTLVFEDGTFDLVTAIETHYFWPDLNGDLKEVLRVLKPGGTLIIIGAEYKGGKHEKWIKRWVEQSKMAIQSPEELRGILRHAGYSEVGVFEDYDGGRFCAVGKRPAGG